MLKEGHRLVSCTGTSQDKIGQGKESLIESRQQKTRQDKTGQAKPRQDKTRQDKTRQDKTRQDITQYIQDKAR
jgi:hypothetical protein